MGATAVTRPVGVDELRRAYHAVLAGEFRATPGGARRRPPAPLPATGITGTS